MVLGVSSSLAASCSKQYMYSMADEQLQCTIH